MGLKLLFPKSHADCIHTPSGLFFLSVFLLYSRKCLLYMMALSFNQSITSTCCSSLRNWLLLPASLLGCLLARHGRWNIIRSRNMYRRSRWFSYITSPNSDCVRLDALEDWVLSSWGSLPDSVGNTLGALSLGLALALLDFPLFFPFEAWCNRKSSQYINVLIDDKAKECPQNIWEILQILHASA